MMHYILNWSFYNPVKALSGPGTIKEVPALVLEALGEKESKSSGNNPGGQTGNGASQTGSREKGLIVTSPGFVKRGQAARLQEFLSERKLAADLISTVKPNPEVKEIEAYTKRLKDKNYRFLIGAGGGSVIDTAKALSYLLNTGSGFSLSEHFAGRCELTGDVPLPLVAVPTTAGTGSEATPFATIWEKEKQKKYSLAKHDLFPSAAVLDGELTLSLPDETTISTGLDVLSHALESVWNINANPVTTGLAAQAVEIVLSTLPALIKEPENLDQRQKMLAGSFLGGICISATRTALAHSISYPVTAALGAPHGLACAFTIPALLEYNAKEDDGRFQEVARLAGCESVPGLANKISELFEQVKVKELLAKYRVTEENLQKLVSGMFTPERAGNNLRPVDNRAVQEILKKSLRCF
ncbi:MAG: phosphonoacetaldehyde reductase [Bacillota bacterium]